MARLLAAAARLLAHLTMGEAEARMTLALVAADSAGLHTDLQSSARRRQVEGSLARENGAGRQAPAWAQSKHAWMHSTSAFAFTGGLLGLAWASGAADVMPVHSPSKLFSLT